MSLSNRWGKTESVTGAMNYLQSIEADGFAVIDPVIDGNAISRLQDELQTVQSAGAVRRRNGTTFGIRNVLKLVPFVRSLLESDRLSKLVTQLGGEKARVVRSLFFDKTADANWTVLWHQDLTIAVREKRLLDGFGRWSIKAGIPHVQPPTPILERILTLRIHLDDTDESNGALRLIPGSHARGRLSASKILRLTAASKPTICRVRAGGIVAMKPLILHSSSSGSAPSHRRVLHLEFSPDELPGGLEWYES